MAKASDAKMSRPMYCYQIKFYPAFDDILKQVCPLCGGRAILQSLGIGLGKLACTLIPVLPLCYTAFYIYICIHRGETLVLASYIRVLLLLGHTTLFQGVSFCQQNKSCYCIVYCLISCLLFQTGVCKQGCLWWYVWFVTWRWTDQSCCSVLQQAYYSKEEKRPEESVLYSQTLLILILLYFIHIFSHITPPRMATTQISSVGQTRLLFSALRS